MRAFARTSKFELIAASLALGLCGLGVSKAEAQPMRDLVEQVLDQKIDNVQINELPLPEALARLGEKTGLAFVMDPGVMELMPYGERTKVSIDLQNVPVREGLRRAFDGLGLIMRLEGDKLHILPSPPLERLGRRMTIQEVRLLATLADKTWSDLPAESRTLQFRGITGDNPQQILETAVRATQGPNAAEQLESATKGLGWCWVPQDGSILVYSRAEDIRNRLERPIDLDFRGVPLDEVLVDLGQRIGLTISFEPGVLERIQARQRRLDLVHRGTTVRQTLERIAGSTGIAYEVTDAGVLIKMAASATSMPAGAGGRIVAMLRIPVGKDGTCVELPFYEGDVPPEIQRLLDQRVPAVLEELRRNEERQGG